MHMIKNGLGKVPAELRYLHNHGFHSLMT